MLILVVFIQLAFDTILSLCKQTHGGKDKKSSSKSSEAVPKLSKERHIRWINNRLRPNIKVMKRQIEDLEIQLSKREGHP